MKNILKPTGILLIICVISSTILSVLYSRTKPIIEANNKAAIEAARKAVLPDAVKESFTAVDVNNIASGQPDFEPDSILFYKGYNQAGELAGFTYKSAGQGYSSSTKVVTMVGINLDLKIDKIKIIKQQETPGLGANCTSTDFTQHFSHKDPSTIKVDKDGGEIESITGATITTRAVTNSIRDEFLTIKKDMMKQLDKGAE